MVCVCVCGNAQWQNFEQARTFFRACCCEAATHFPENVKAVLEDECSSSDTEDGFAMKRRYPKSEAFTHIQFSVPSPVSK